MGIIKVRASSRAKAYVRRTSDHQRIVNKIIRKGDLSTRMDKLSRKFSTSSLSTIRRANESPRRIASLENRRVAATKAFMKLRRTLQ